MSRPTLAALALGLTFAVPTRPLIAQGASAPTAADLAKPLSFDPLVTVGTLDNGLRYYIRVNKMPAKRVELRLAVNAGAVLEADDQIGLAHVTEHMAFNGTVHFPKNDLVHYLQSIGSRFGADVNAYTNVDETVYMLTIPTDTGSYLQTGVEILADWAHGQLFDSNEVNSERGVVTEEWRLRRGAFARMQDIQFPILLKGSRYAQRNVIGTASYLQTFPQEALRRFYHDWYRPDMMAVVAVGDFDKDKMEQAIRSQFGQIPRLAGAKPRPSYPIPPHDSTYFAIATDKEATNSSFTIYDFLPRRDQSTLGSFRLRFTERLGTAMLNQRLSEIAQKPDAPFAFTAIGRGYYNRSADAATVFGGVKEGGIVRGFDAVFTEVERVNRFGFTSTELDRAKASLLREQEGFYAERDKQPSSMRADEIVRNFLYGEDVLGTEAEYAMYKQLLPGVTLDEVNQATRDLLTEKNRVVTVNAPDKAGVPVPTEAEMLSVYRSVKAKTLLPYKDVVITAALLAKIPAPAAIVSTRSIPEVGVTEWKLANGVRVVLKPTDFQNDQIVLTAFSPGGTSLVPDSLYTSATYATMALGTGGLGEFSAIDLRKLLTGRVASVNPMIGTRMEGLTGIASPKDVETMFQLVYLRFTAPRKDSAAWLATKQSFQASMANLSANPQKTFSDTIVVTMSQGHLRARPLGPATLDQVNLDRAMAIYRDRFADASDFTFFLVGTFNVDSIKPLVQRYLGALPSLNRKEIGRDVGIRPPTGVVDKTVHRGTEPQSQTFLSFTGPYAYSAANQYVLSSFGQLLTMRLTDRLREALGGTYSINAFASGSRDEPQQYSLTIQFGSAPERAAELTKAVFAELKALSDSGPTAAEIERVQATQRRVRETSLRQNLFWSGQLSNAYQYGDDPRDILAYGKQVNGLTAAAIRDAARRYARMDNYVHITLLPEVARP
jgi:zinc protease